MPRIIGVDIPTEKRVEVSLTYIYGVGKSNVKMILKQAQIDPNKRAKDLTDQEVARIIRVLEEYTVEGGLRRQIIDNIQRLKQIKSYRGLRHIAKLPARGQRTRVNARTRRGKRRTVGSLTKEMAQKLESSKK